MAFPLLETDRLQLVRIEKKHAESFFDIMSRDEVTKYYGMNNLENIDEANKIIDSFQTNFERKRAIRWGIILKETREFVGTLGLNNLEIRGKKAEIGFEIHPSYWKKGITTEAVKKVLQYSFDKLNLYRIGAIAYPQNSASIQLLEGIGFKKEGLLRGYLYQNNQSHDAFIFSLLSTEC